MIISTIFVWLVMVIAFVLAIILDGNAKLVILGVFALITFLLLVMTWIGSVNIYIGR